MNMNYYNASNHFSAPIRREPKPYSPEMRRPEIITPQKPMPPASTESPKSEKKAGLQFSDLESDDLLLIALIALLIWNSCEDAVLLYLLAYLFFAGLDR